MGDYYHHFLTSMSGVTASQSMSPQDTHPPQFPGSHMPMMGGAMPGPYTNIGYFTGFPDPVGLSAPKSSRNRRKSAPGLDHVKHRRTRSGCYMCRSRRVKCDETRPICDRCRKGSRECIYPEPPATKVSTGQTTTTPKDTTTTQQASPDSSNDPEDAEEETEPTGLDTILDEDEGDDESYQKHFTGPSRSSTASSFNPQRAGWTPGSSETPPHEGTKSASPSASVGTSSSQATTTYAVPDLGLLSLSSHTDWSHLPTDLRQHLEYFCENVTHYHYCMLTDAHEIFRVVLPNYALQNEALLYAVVGFAAYQRTLQDPDGKIEDFLKYYNKSVILLLNSLKRKEKHGIATLLTVLQLATIEEYLGDWINLMGHQKAAFEMLTHLFTHETASQSPLGRMIVSWYGRFDIFIALMGGFPTMLPRQWFTTFVEHCDKQAAVDEDSLHWKMEAESGRLRVISREMSTLFARGSRGQISQEDFAIEHERIQKELHDWKDGWDRALTDPVHLVTDFSHARPLNEDDIVDPFVPGVLYDFPVFSTTMLTSEWNSTTMMHKCQSPTSKRAELYAELKTHAYAICQIFEAVENWPSRPKGSLILIQACIALSALFLPQDPKHHMWIRRKFALLETMGYIHPITLRSKMAELFHEPSCVRWWLPADKGFSRVLQSVRTFADERNANAISSQMENLREVRHIFAKMQMFDEASAQGSHTTTA
ncbi:C6 finger domain-containing protein [Colletotrichum truncatum]|uniref:C6 finger domain-containing protein n=1 Tax=Colletotrichum truncatum TaxID=5467 RepID=A0ACC3ZJQ2_COLTU|nr:C6 finger domain-containing protein [Colletotrichum truncatum]KAF6799735.1 C6 finger domain-containing protein [Colletotrichum truncatum]